MRDVLFIAYDFPPGPGIGSALRSAFFARYLPEFGWQPTIVSLDGGQQHTEGVIRLRSQTPWQRPYEVTPYGWAYALQRWLKRQRRGRWDLVYVSCPPFPQALTATAYAQRQDVRCIVDFRDAWSLDPYQEGSQLKRWLYQNVFPSLERGLLKRTDLLLLNTPSALDAYRAAYPKNLQRMAYLPNGFDERAFGQLEPRDGACEEGMRLLYAGRFGIGARSPKRLFAALAAVRARGCDISLDIIGRQPPAVLPAVDEAEKQGMVRALDEVGYDEVVEHLHAADALVLIQAPSAGAIQAVAGKTYDYLRSARPIFVVAPEGDNLTLIREHAADFEYSADSVDAMTDALERLYRRWRTGDFAGPREPPATYLEQFSRRTLTAQLARRFDGLVDAQPDGGSR